MNNYDTKAIISRIENIANKVYRGSDNSVFMLINDLEEFFEIDTDNNAVERMTTDEFEQYIAHYRN